MGFGQRWPERVPRPKARRLTEEEKDEILATLRKVIAGSPVLSSFGVEVQSSRGRFYIQRQREDDDFSLHGGMGQNHAARWREEGIVARSQGSQGRLVRGGQGIGTRAHRSHRQRQEGDISKAPG